MGVGLVLRRDVITLSTVMDAVVGGGGRREREQRRSNPFDTRDVTYHGGTILLAFGGCGAGAYGQQASRFTRK